ncbi:hypothetical protein [Parafrankia sp. FMc2]|uniref:hypothetical protein n=1 Tax=Parafrankia sp. FMc2 TaxID=3233196 RepID=UPI0034D4A51A
MGATRHRAGRRRVSPRRAGIARPLASSLLVVALVTVMLVAAGVGHHAVSAMITDRHTTDDRPGAVGGNPTAGVDAEPAAGRSAPPGRAQAAGSSRGPDAGPVGSPAPSAPAPQGVAGAPVAPSTPASQSPASGTATPGRPTTTAPPAAAASSPSVRGAITSPGSGARVQRCAIVSGTSSGLPAGKTLILAMSNLDNNDPEKYIADVSATGRSGGLSSWQGRQWFGSDDSEGQRYRVELMMVDTAANDRRDDLDRLSSLTGPKEVLAWVDVERVRGGTDSDCG